MYILGLMRFTYIVDWGITNYFILCQFQTYLVDKQIPDSAGTATTLLRGVKVNDANVKNILCSSVGNENHLTTFIGSDENTACVVRCLKEC